MIAAMHQVRAMRPGEEGAVVAALAEAFQRDEFAAWLIPSDSARRQAMGAMFASLINNLSSDSEVDVTDDLGAAALWLPPGADVSSPSPPGAVPVVLEAFTRINQSIPRRGYWYLKFIGARQLGGGGGSALLQARHRRTDAARLPTALWTGAEVNLNFYRKHGYRVLERLDFDGASAWWMWRDPIIGSLA